MPCKLAIITRDDSDFSEMLSLAAVIRYMTPDEADEVDFSSFDAICILGGTRDRPLALNPIGRTKVEEQRLKGKKIFAEYCAGIGDAYSDNPVRTRSERLVCYDDSMSGLIAGDLLDDHCNYFCAPNFVFGESRVLLYYENYICAHDHTEVREVEGKNWALWFLDNTTLQASFRMANFRKARLAPMERWNAVMSYIVKWLIGAENVKTLAPVAASRSALNKKASLTQAIHEGLDWFIRAGMILNEGKTGVLEGLSHDIDPNGNQTVCTSIRTDCCGEVAGAFRFDARFNGSVFSRTVADNLSKLIFDGLQIKCGLHKGMLRWSNIAFGVCYQDDVARAVIPSLLDMKLGGNQNDLPKICEALDYIIKTTGTDGLRPMRTDCHDMTEESMRIMRDSAASFPSAHYNAYYHAALLLAGSLTECDRYIDIAEKGLSSIMLVYPNTQREQSETEELCRLVFPLACLYEVTGKEKHLSWLLKVEKDLECLRVPGGGYAEWDTDYRAACSRNDTGECSLLAENGDPIVDLLYSVNWLPLGFAYAYRVTKDQRFKSDFEDLAEFLIGAQMVSDDPKLNGGWTRAYDWKRREAYGVPHDVGWGPCCMETGWTAAEILIGLQYGIYVCGLGKE